MFDIDPTADLVAKVHIQQWLEQHPAATLKDVRLHMEKTYPGILKVPDMQAYVLQLLASRQPLQ